MGNLTKAIDYLVNIAEDDSHGYSQANRYSPDYDCSSSILAALKYGGGFDVNEKGYTGNMLSILKSIGYAIISDNRCLKGDIFLTPNKHVVMAVADNTVVTAAGDKDGKTGDSSGKEIYKRTFYTPSYGWKYHLRMTSTDTPVFITGRTYELLYNLCVRKAPGIKSEMVGYAGLTEDGKKHDKDKNGCLDKGTRVTCKEIKNVGYDIWIQIPSGWIAAYYQGCVFVEEC